MQRIEPYRHPSFLLYSQLWGVLEPFLTVTGKRQVVSSQLSVLSQAYFRVHADIHTYGQFTFPSNLTHMLLNYRMKPDYPERTHTDTGKDMNSTASQMAQAQDLVAVRLTTVPSACPQI